jgi:predicted DNA repair protein MutK
VLTLVALGITGAVYGAVALIVKADDVGLSLASAEAIRSLGGLEPRLSGAALVYGMPYFLKCSASSALLR